MSHTSHLEDSTVLSDANVLNESISQLEAIASLLTAHRAGWHLSTPLTLETMVWTLRRVADDMEAAGPGRYQDEAESEGGQHD